MKNFLVIVILFLGIAPMVAQQIVIDEKFEDWQQGDLKVDDSGDQLSGTDIQALWITNDEKYIYFRMDFDREIQLQGDNSIQLAIDIDNNANTGFPVSGIGSEISFEFGARSGFFNPPNGGFVNIRHFDIGLVPLPTVTSNRFEFLIKRDFTISGTDYRITGDIAVRLDDDRFNGDKIPNENGGFVYNIDDEKELELEQISFALDERTDFRIMSLNALRDNIFESFSSQPLSRILSASKPDIIAFQEIYDHTSAETVSLIDNIYTLPSGENWHHSSEGADIHLLSRYPIKHTDFIAGNGAFVVEIENKDVLIINVHLPCCENDQDRQNEIDRILKYIREVQNGLSSYDLPADSPIIILGDFNLVGLRQQIESLLTGDIVNNGQYGSDISPDWDGSDLEDALPNVTGIPASYTWFDNGSFFPGRLDYILYSGSVLRLDKSISLNTRTASNSFLQESQLSAADTEIVSDHLPLFADFSFDLTSSVNSLSHSAISIFPNPAQDIIYFNTNVDFESVEIYNTHGQIVQRNKVKGKKSIDICNLKKGFYVIKFLKAENTVGKISFVKIGK